MNTNEQTSGFLCGLGRTLGARKEVKGISGNVWGGGGSSKGNNLSDKMKAPSELPQVVKGVRAPEMETQRKGGDGE